MKLSSNQILCFLCWKCVWLLRGYQWGCEDNMLYITHLGCSWHTLRRSWWHRSIACNKSWYLGCWCGYSLGWKLKIHQNVKPNQRCYSKYAYSGVTTNNHMIFFFEVTRQVLIIKVSGAIFDNDRSVRNQCSPDCWRPRAQRPWLVYENSFEPFLWPSPEFPGGGLTQPLEIRLIDVRWFIYK